jgi:hypothetical protein
MSTNRYEIRYANGTRTTCGTRADATATLEAQGFFVYDGDGARTLAWRTEEESRDDDGLRAVAEVVEVAS